MLSVDRRFPESVQEAPHRSVLLNARMGRRRQPLEYLIPHSTLLSSEFPTLMPSIDRGELLRRRPAIQVESLVASYDKLYPRAMNYLQQVGIHPKSGKRDFFNPWTNKLLIEDFCNIGVHGVLVGAAAHALGTALGRAGALSTSDIEQIVHRAILHDALKPWDIMLRKSQGISPTIPKVSDGSKFDLVVDVLRNYGLPFADAYSLVHDYGVETSVKGFPFKMVQYRDARPQCVVKGAWTDKIIWLADAMTLSIPPTDQMFGAKNIYVTPWERLVGCEAPVRYQDDWYGGIYVSTTGDLTAALDLRNRSLDGDIHVGTYHQFFVWGSQLIAQEILTCIGETTTRAAAADKVRDLVSRTVLSSHG